MRICRCRPPVLSEAASLRTNSTPQLFGAGAGGILEMVGPELIAQTKSEVEAKEGCRVYGKLEVSRVTGNFHLSVHHASSELLQQAFGKAKINFSHVIHKLHFGKGFKGVVNPLDGLVREVKEAEDPGQFKYFLKVGEGGSNGPSRRLPFSQAMLLRRRMGRLRTDDFVGACRSS